MQTSTLTNLAGWLERAVILTAVAALAFRGLLYPDFERAPNAHYGPGDIIDFAFAAVLFVMCLACALCGVILTARLASARADATEFIRVEAMPFSQVQKMVESGEIVDSMTILSVLLEASRRGRG